VPLDIHQTLEQERADAEPAFGMCADRILRLGLRLKVPLRGSYYLATGKSTGSLSLKEIKVVDQRWIT
jgi:hypothetical protein